MRYLLTGAAGFIGAHLANEISRNGDEVLGIDSYSDYYAISLKKERVKTLLTSKEISLIEGDVRDLEIINQLIQDFKPNVVIHLAAQPGVRIPISDLNKYTESNLAGFCNVLSAVVRNSVPNFLYASSSSVYGEDSQTPFSEKETNLNPLSFYGATKLSNEILTHSLIRNSSTRARGLRFFTVYGPWGRPDMAYFRLAASAVSNVLFNKYGDGQVIRDFTYIKDVTEIVYSLSKQLTNYKPGFADIVNIGGGKPNSLNEMITEIANISGTKLNLNSELGNLNDVKLTHADPKYLVSLINRKPEIELNTGLKSVLEWASKGDISSKMANWTSSVV